MPAKLQQQHPSIVSLREDNGTNKKDDAKQLHLCASKQFFFSEITSMFDPD